MSATNISASHQKPVFYIQYEIANATVDIRLNDIPVLQHDDSGTTRSEKPVPESIVDGENILSVSITPPDGEDNVIIDGKYADVRLIVREHGAPLNDYKVLTHLRINAAGDIDSALSGSEKGKGEDPEITKLQPSEISAHRRVQIASPFPRWAWQDGVELTDDKKTYDELFEEYKHVYAVLSSKNMKRIKDLYSDAAREYAAAYHYDDIDEGHRIMNTGELAIDPAWELGDIQILIEDKVEFKLDIFANNKLARLVTPNGKEMFIVYFNDDDGLVSLQKFGFYKTQDDEWVMIR